MSALTTLGIIAKSLYNGNGRSERYRLQDIAADVLAPKHRTCSCGRALASGRHGVRLVLARDPADELHASFHNVQTCSNVWVCPVCAAKISEVRRKELNALLGECRARGWFAYLVTFTMRHDVSMNLPSLLSTLRRAKMRWHNSRAYRLFAQVGAVMGHVTATEITYGEYGWHPHLHMIVVTSGRAFGLLEQLRETWERALASESAYGNGYAYQVQDASCAGDYVAKWGTAAEMTLSGRKNGRSGSRGVWQLLSDAGAGDDCARSRWLEYAAAMAGKRQLVWSRGLKHLVGLYEVPDSAAAEDVEEYVEVQSVEIDRATWAWICERGERGSLLWMAEYDWNDAIALLTTLWRG